MNRDNILIMIKDVSLSHDEISKMSGLLVSEIIKIEENEMLKEHAEALEWATDGYGKYLLKFKPN